MANSTFIENGDSTILIETVSENVTRIPSSEKFTKSLQLFSKQVSDSLGKLEMGEAPQETNVIFTLKLTDSGLFTISNEDGKGNFRIQMKFASQPNVNDGIPVSF